MCIRDRYHIEETTVPQHYVDVGFETEVEIRDNGRTCEIEVENEPTKGYIRITKDVYKRQDETFRRLIEEAEKYIGYPYVWGGDSPETSFDLSLIHI